MKYLEKNIKKTFFKMARLFLNGSLKRKEQIDFSRIKKILVVRQDRKIGNLLLTTPFLFSLKEFFPGAEIFYLASKTFQNLFSNHSVLDGIFAVDKSKYIFNPFSFIKLIKKIRRQNFDICFDLSDENQISATNLLYTYLSRAKYRIGHQREGSGGFLNIEVPKEEKPKHAVDMHLDLLRFLFREVKSSELKIDVPDNNQKKALNYLARKGVNENDFLIGINLGGRGKKRWGKENFLDVADWLVGAFDCKVILIWGPEEKALVKDLIFEKDIVLADLLPLLTLAALIKRCNLFISSDSGIMHLSTAVRTPTFALFIDSDPVKYGPRGTKHRIIVSKDGEVSIEKVKKELKEFIISLKKKDKSFKPMRNFFDKTSPPPSPYKGEGKGEVYP